jgi:hypothetical protein
MNSELAAALDAAPESGDFNHHINLQIASVADSIKADTSACRPPERYARRTTTVAALMMFDPTVRQMAINAGVDLYAFGESVEKVSLAISVVMNQKNDVGAKVFKTLVYAYQDGRVQ